MELVGIAEIADLARSSKQNVSNWATRDGNFPKPVAELACGSIWDKSAVLAWLESAGRLPGSSPGLVARSRGFRVGVRYSHADIKAAFPGNTMTYLPHTQEGIVCGLFGKALNPRAPREVLVGDGPQIQAVAEQMATQGGAIPVFVKHSTNDWEFCGLMAFDRYERDPGFIRKRAAEARRSDVVGVLVFRDADPAVD